MSRPLKAPSPRTSSLLTPTPHAAPPYLCLAILLHLLAFRQVPSGYVTQPPQEGEQREDHVPGGTDDSSSPRTSQKGTVLPPPHPRPAAAAPEPPLRPEISPLTTLEELLGYENAGWGQSFAPARPRPTFVAGPFPPLESRLLVCHDYDGGYGEDRLVQGGGYDRPYRMYDWGLINIFVYFR